MLTEIINFFEEFNSYIPVSMLMYWLNPYNMTISYFKIKKLIIEIRIKEEELKNLKKIDK